MRPNIHPLTGIIAAVLMIATSAPADARFLSKDPVPANPNNGQNFNSYWYANNNPYKFTDPDGRIVAYAFKNGATRNDQVSTMDYLAQSPTAAGEIQVLKDSSEKYTISFDPKGETGYDRDTRTVVVNPTQGLIVKSSGEIQSPALGGGHEITHAAQHDRVGTANMVKSLEAPVTSATFKDGKFTVTYQTSPEEARATTVEGQMARELGEPARKNYTDESGPVTTCGPTSTTQC